MDEAGKSYVEGTNYYVPRITVSEIVQLTKKAELCQNYVVLILKNLKQKVLS